MILVLLPGVISGRKKLTGQEREALKGVLIKWREDRAKQFGVPYFFHVLDQNEASTGQE